MRWGGVALASLWGCSVLFPVNEFGVGKEDGGTGNMDVGASQDGGTSCEARPHGCGPVVELVAGHGFACARLEGGSVYCWGSDLYKTLGGSGAGTPCAEAADFGVDAGTFRTQSPCNPVPQRIAGVEDAAQIAAGPAAVCVLTQAGEVLCWGRNTGEFGVNPFELSETCGRFRCSSKPLKMRGLPPNQRILEVALGSGGAQLGASCVRSEQDIACLGVNAFGVLGEKDPAQTHSPVTVFSQGGSAISMSLSSEELGLAGIANYCTIKTNNAVCWGHRGTGVVGLPDASDLGYLCGSGSDRCLPPSVVPQALGSRVRVGPSQACVLDEGQLRCWGMNREGQLGRYPAVNAGAGDVGPFPVTTVHERERFASFDLRANHLLALRENGELVAWGSNNQGQLARDPQSQLCLNLLPCSAEPWTVPLPSRVVLFAAGAGFSVAKTADGRIWAWGANMSGELGHAPQPSSGDSTCTWLYNSAARTACNPVPSEVRGLPTE